MAAVLIADDPSAPLAVQSTLKICWAVFVKSLLSGILRDYWCIFRSIPVYSDDVQLDCLIEIVVRT